MFISTKKKRAIIYWLVKKAFSSLNQSERKLSGLWTCFVGALGSGVGWGRSCQCAHAHSVGNAIENGELCRALQKTSWTRPLGTTAGAPEDSPGDYRTGTPLTGVNGDSFPGDNPAPSETAAAEKSAPSTPFPLFFSSAFGTARETPRHWQCCF